MENTEENSKKIGKIQKKICPTVRGNNSVIGDITLNVGNQLQLCMCKDNIKVGEITLYVEV